MEKVYWTMKNGQKIDIDSMDRNHLVNTLKMIVRNNKPKTKEFELNGDMANEFHNSITEDFYSDEEEYSQNI
jgi:hypothetical protein